MMNLTSIARGASAALLLAILSACDSGGGSTSAGDGRTRLSLDNSYAEIGDFVVHINGMTSDALQPDVAKNYGIVRSEDHGLVNLVVLRKAANLGMDEPVEADVSVSAANLTGQLKNVKLSEIIDGDSIYYIAEVSVADEEIINFDFDVLPEGGDDTLLIRFSHSFYTR